MTKKKDQTLRKGKDLLKDDALLYDITYFFSRGMPISHIATKFKKSTQSVVSYLQRAFQSGVVQMPLAGPSRLARQLEGLFPGIQVCVISASEAFYPLAAIQILKWIKDLCWPLLKEKQDPWIAIGGGRTMRSLADSLEEALNVDGELRSWFAKRAPGARLNYINATAGGKASEPELDASYLSVLFSKITQGRGHNFSLAGKPSIDEGEVLESALENTRIIVSGIGGPSSYCSVLMNQLKILTVEYKQLAGEFLYYPFDSEGEWLLKDELPRKVEIKEETRAEHGKAERQPAPTWATLATLFKLESMREKREGLMKRSVVTVATCDLNDGSKKAEATCAISRAGILTHLCVSADLAWKIIDWEVERIPSQFNVQLKKP